MSYVKETTIPNKTVSVILPLLMPISHPVLANALLKFLWKILRNVPAIKDQDNLLNFVFMSC